MTRQRHWLFAGAMIVVAGVAWSQSKSGLGEHKRATDDPLFLAQEFLGRPTDTSITVNAAARKRLEIYYEFGTMSGSYTGKTAPSVFPAGEPQNVLIDKLQPNTQYFYRMRYRGSGSGDFLARPEHGFHTARPAGSTYTFTAQFDPHLDENIDDETYKLTLKNMVADHPDFMIDLGDNFFVDKLRPPTKEGVEQRVQLMRSYYDILSHSSALFLAIGNHEGEWGRHLNGTAENVAVYDTLARKRYIPNPEPNGFYTGSTKQEPFVGLRQANYSWQWGDALFIVLDPYWHQPVPPELSGDWSLTLGREQYEWLKKTLETSTAKYKFVFSHNLIGGLNMNGPMRGGIATVKYLEMGGYNLDGTWGWDRARPGWAKPIHQLLVDNKATIYFHGHDHVYAKEDLDGIVYQEGPQPGAMNAEGRNTQDKKSGGNRYKYVGTVLGGTGYLRVRVSPEDVKVEFVQTWVPSKETSDRKNGMIADTYTIKAGAARAVAQH
jgi:Calcineurin-like phosphoesterase